LAAGWQRGFLIVHGLENRRPVGHWERWLAHELRARGEQVWYPQLPEPDRPALAAWLDVIHAELSMMGDGERVVVCHSLGCIAWLHYASGLAAQRIDRVLLVAPPGPAALDQTGLADFSLAAVDLEALRAGVPTRLVATDNDEWCEEQAAEVYGGPLGCDVDLLPGEGHLALADGYGSWPGVLAWCLDPAARVGPRDAVG